MFENDHGFIDSRKGSLFLRGEKLKNGSGKIISFSIDGTLYSFSNKSKGLIAANSGQASIEATYQLKQHGKIIAAHGINLSVLQGPYLGMGGNLICPSQLLVIKSTNSLINLEGNTLEVGACKLESLEQINMQSTQLSIAGPLHVKSETQWIEAQKAYFAHVGAPAYFEAKESIYFNDNKGKLNSLNVHCKAFNLDFGAFSVKEDFKILVDRFRGNHNGLEIGGQAHIQATSSISSNQSEIKVINGSFVQESQDWLVSHEDTTYADVIRRNGANILLSQGIDTGKKYLIIARNGSLFKNIR